MKKMREADTDEELQLMITFNPSVVRIEQCMRECMLEVVDEIIENKHTYTWMGDIDEDELIELKQKINEQ